MAMIVIVQSGVAKSAVTYQLLRICEHLKNVYKLLGEQIQINTSSLYFI